MSKAMVTRCDAEGCTEVRPDVGYDGWAALDVEVAGGARAPADLCPVHAQALAGVPRLAAALEAAARSERG